MFGLCRKGQTGIHPDFYALRWHLGFVFERERLA